LIVSTATLSVTHWLKLIKQAWCDGVVVNMLTKSIHFLPVCQKLCMIKWV